MSIVVFAYYDYWGDNGRCHQKWVEEFEDESSAISECCNVSAVHDIGFVVEKVVGVSDAEDFKARVSQAVEARSASDKLKLRISKLKEYIKYNEEWLENVVSETEKKIANLAEYRKNLAELEA